MHSRPDMKGRVDRRDEKQNTPAYPSEKTSTESEGAMEGKQVRQGKDDNEYRIKYRWICYAGAQNDGKGCDTWKVMDVKTKGRGPFVRDTSNL